jgi:phosphoglycerol transferase MdoB-like AlkP superfamily enzyme
MSNFIGRDDFKDPIFIDPTWGVSDQDMFNRALEELDRMPADRPFYAILQTLSNHTPYALPEKLPVEAVTGFGKLDQHLTAQRYSDWALGQFFSHAVDSPWYKDTLFVIVGDHGFAINRQLAEIDLLRFRVPLLLLGPGIRETYGAINHTVATQTDVVPTVVGLLGKPFVHQCWGRNLLSLQDNDPGVGVIKPSGSDLTVALIRGEQLLIKPPKGKEQLGQYAFYPDEYYRQEQDDELNEELATDLAAFIQSGLQSLRGNRTGVPAEQAQ